MKEREKKRVVSGFHHSLLNLKRKKSPKPLPSLLLSDVYVLTAVKHDLVTPQNVVVWTNGSLNYSNVECTSVLLERWTEKRSSGQDLRVWFRIQQEFEVEHLLLMLQLRLSSQGWEWSEVSLFIQVLYSFNSPAYLLFKGIVHTNILEFVYSPSCSSEPVCCYYTGGKGEHCIKHLKSSSKVRLFCVRKRLKFEIKIKYFIEYFIFSSAMKIKKKKKLNSKYQ